MEEKKMSRPAVDWEAVEKDYRAGVKTLRQIAEEHGITHGAVNKRAKKESWPRDLAAKIQARADALVSKAEVSNEVSKEAKISERQIVEANAQAVVNVRLAHRSDIAKARNTVTALLTEMEAQCGTENAALLEQLGEMLRSPDEFGNDKLNDLYVKIISLPGRAKTMKDLAESLSKLIDKERQAFGLDKDTKEEDKAISLTDVQRVSRLATLFDKARRVAASSESCSTD